MGKRMGKMDENRIRLFTDMLPSVSLCGYLSTDTGFVHPDRVLDVNVLLYVEEGSFHIFEEEEEFTVEAGDLLFLKQGLHHFGDVKCPKGTKWFFVHFHLEEGDGGRELAPYERFLYTETEEPRVRACHVLPKTIHIERGTRIFSRFMTLERMFSSRDYSANLNLNAYLYEILMDIYEQTISERHIDGKSEKVQKMMTFLDERSDRPFDSGELEEFMGLTFKHLNLLFKQTTGTTLWKYHSSARTERAKRLLAATTLSIGEISDALHFESPYYFCNVFKKQTGIAPSQYRKENLI
ncbi:MAG: helix-turn-helix transcriptional regulator [Lachnospiraceae bacterium]|nr:helix-turn-helix transcriptional regulator [Lachnospiraceae bacterium]